MLNMNMMLTVSCNVQRDRRKRHLWKTQWDNLKEDNGENAQAAMDVKNHSGSQVMHVYQVNSR